MHTYTLFSAPTNHNTMPPRRSARAAAAASVPAPSPPPASKPASKPASRASSRAKKARTPTPSPSPPPAAKNTEPLKDCRIVVGLPGKLGTDLSDQVVKLGAKVSNNVTKTVTHLIATPLDISKGSAKLTAAGKFPGIFVVDERWVDACEKEGERVDEAEYVKLAAAGVTGTANGTASANGTKGKGKRAASPDSDDDKPAKRGKANGTGECGAG